MNAQTIDSSYSDRSTPIRIRWCSPRISGAHLYGFPSPDSDFDLRGVHLLPLEQVVGPAAGQETSNSRASTTAWRSTW